MWAKYVSLGQSPLPHIYPQNFDGDDFNIPIHIVRNQFRKLMNYVWTLSRSNIYVARNRTVLSLFDVTLRQLHQIVCCETDVYRSEVPSVRSWLPLFFLHITSTFIHRRVRPLGLTFRILWFFFFFLIEFIYIYICISYANYL